MNDREYAEHVEEYSTSAHIDEAYFVAPAEAWELSDFEDIVGS